jgi:hypothetical protein
VEKKTGNSAASVSSKKKKSSDASAKLAEDSDDDFMPDKHGNLPWKKKQVTVMHQRHRRRRNQAMHQQSPLKIVMMTLCQTSTETYRGKKSVDDFMYC